MKKMRLEEGNWLPGDRLNLNLKFGTRSFLFGTRLSFFPMIVATKMIFKGVGSISHLGLKFPLRT